MKPLDLPPRPRILVVTLRRLGDVLFATPLIASLRRALPQSVIHVLVFEDTAGILTGNPDIDQVVTMPSRPSFWQGLALVLRLAKRYHLAVSTQSGDRPTAFALVAGRQHVGPTENGARGALRRLLLSRSVEPQPGLHRLEDMLRLADALGIARVGNLVCPGGGSFLSPGLCRDPATNCSSPSCGEGSGGRVARGGKASPQCRDAPHQPSSSRNRVYAGFGQSIKQSKSATADLDWGERVDGPYAVIHAAPMFVYKRWLVEGWQALAVGVRARGLKIVATGGPAAAERAYLDEVWGKLPDTVRYDGQLSWPELAALVAGARLFIGTDTSVTHLAAATGCPTVALFGPTDPRLWGPVPAEGLDLMWAASGTIQRRKNVWLVQNPLPCLPCQNEGCERHILSFSRCLDELAPAQVLYAVDAALASRSISAVTPTHATDSPGGHRR